MGPHCKISTRMSARRYISRGDAIRSMAEGSVSGRHGRAGPVLDRGIGEADGGVIDSGAGKSKIHAVETQKLRTESEEAVAKNKLDAALHKSRLYRPLRPGPESKIEFDNEDNVAYRYEFFIPAAIWRHTATVAFLNTLQAIEPNSTVFKGAVGAWKNEVEDVNIYVMILKKGEWNPDNVRTGLRDAIADLMARLAEWRESIQQAFLFTETTIRMNLTTHTDFKKAISKFETTPKRAGKQRPVS